MKTQAETNKVEDITVTMLNADGYYFSLTPDSILDLQIEENLTRWWMKGYVDIKNTHDWIERTPPAGGRIADLTQLNKETFNKGKKSDSVYSFRNDGMDIMFVQFQLPETAGDHFHNFSGFFNVYRVEDVDVPDSDIKIKRLMIIDERFHRMSHMNLPWSTTSLTENSTASMRHGTASRKANTGDAIKHILKLSLGEKTPFAKAWDSGDESSKILYTSPANYKCIDDLEYLVGSHISHEDIGGGKGVLYFDRPSNIWRLVNVELLFMYAARFDEEHNKWLAGALQTEEFKIISYPNSPSSKSEKQRTPSGGDRAYTNFNLGERSNITCFEFHEINSADNLSNVVTTPVHLYNKGTKKFHIKQEENSVDAIYDRLTRVIEYTHKDRNQDPSISIDINSIRKLNTNLQHAHSHSTETTKRYLNRGINNAIYNSVLLSNAIEFTVPGHPSRGIGRFISIEGENPDASSDNSSYHDKVYGQYLTTSVVHRYSKNRYTNTVIGVKPYNYQPVHNSVDETPETNEEFKKIKYESSDSTLQDFFTGSVPIPESNE